MIGFFRYLEPWRVDPDELREGYTVITGRQQWDSELLTGVGLGVLAPLLMIVGPWLLPVIIVLIPILLHGCRFSLHITPYGTLAVQRFFFFPYEVVAIGPEVTADLWEDFWEGPDHPVGVEVMDLQSYEGVLVGPSRDLHAQEQLQRRIEIAFAQAEGARGPGSLGCECWRGHHATDEDRCGRTTG
jgi:hypothetical protein